MTRTWLALLVFAAAGWAVYHPALNRVFADDHIFYFAELHGSTDLIDGLALYDYSVSRRYTSTTIVGGKARSENTLFRPLLFAWLAVENTLFSYHHIWWNVANLGLHILVGLALFRLLVAIRKTPLALLVGLLFVVMKPMMELVLWNHLGAYLLAWLLFLIGLRATVQLTGAGEECAGRGTTATFVLAFGAAALIYEPMVVAALIAAIVVLWAEGRSGFRPTAGRLLLLMSPTLLYAALYTTHVHALMTAPPYEVDPNVTRDHNHPGMLAVVLQAIVTTVIWMFELVTPSGLHFVTRAFGRFVIRYDPSWADAPAVLSAIGLLLLLGVSTSARRFAQARPVICLVLGALGAYIAIINIGRPFWPNILTISYYLYGFGLFLLILAYALVDFDRLHGTRYAAAAILLGVLIAAHGTGTFRNTIEIGQANANASLFLTNLTAFVDAHKHEPGFSFAIQDSPPEVDPLFDLEEGFMDDLHRKRLEPRQMSEILFARYYDRARPKYVLDAANWRNGWAPTVLEP